MRIYTTHLRPGRAPRLLREGFSLGAFVFGPLWLLAKGAWIAGVIALVVLVALLVLAGAMSGSTIPPILLLGYAALLGWNGRDLCRWSLARRGFEQSHVLAGQDADAAYARLLERDPLLGAADFP
jgi:fatty acid desaturase